MSNKHFYMRQSDGFYPLFDGDLKLAHPDFEVTETAECPPGFARVSIAPMPEVDLRKFCPKWGAPELVNGVWVSNWVLEPTRFLEPSGG